MRKLITLTVVAFALVAVFAGIVGAPSALQPQEASASTNVIGFDIDYNGCQCWGTLVQLAGPLGGANCCVTPSNNIYVHQTGPGRICHYRVFYRISELPDWHSATTNVAGGGGDTVISWAQQPNASRYDVQVNCDSYVGALYGYAYAA